MRRRQVAAGQAEPWRSRLGISPDSWGVWFAADERQPPWQAFLDGAAAAGYRAIELGPLGYLPTDEVRLARELAARDLRLAGAFLAADLDLAADGRFADDVLGTARLTAAAGAELLLVMGVPYDDLATGRPNRARDPDRDHGRAQEGLARLTERMAGFGLRVALHPHPYTDIATAANIDLALGATPALQLCLDIGQLVFVGADPVAVTSRWLERVAVVHLKDVDPTVLRATGDAGMPFVAAIAAGVFTEIGRGAVDMPALCALLGGAAWPGWWIVEQPLYPVVGADPAASARASAEAIGRLLDAPASAAGAEGEGQGQA